MKKFIIFLFLFVLLFSLFCYAQVSYDTPKEYYSAEEIVQAIKDAVNKYNEDSRAYFLENNSQLFLSKNDTLFNNLNNNPELFTVLENNPELFNIIDQNPQLFLNTLLDEEKLQNFIFSPFNFWKSQKWSHMEGGVSVNNEALFNSSSKKEENYTVQLWKEWGIMK
ncbi:hypothetical protein [Brachyspira hampsonii]|uniref:hypothetical protein n=1 Tax=Brachyspira hampsonii TaxID=1287055 RepID=UPI000D343087|nr:hypothetical protein [Brachyspira hampsonii]PTY39774.1 hypothetical protein DQ06_03965 [Brachyspira hampsonii bv. II]